MSLRTEKGAHEEELRRKYLDYTDEIDSLVKELHDVEIYNYQVAKDHIDVMAKHEKDERQVQEDNEEIRQ